MIQKFVTAAALALLPVSGAAAAASPVASPSSAPVTPADVRLCDPVHFSYNHASAYQVCHSGPPGDHWFRLEITCKKGYLKVVEQGPKRRFGQASAAGCPSAGYRIATTRPLFLPS